MLMTALMRFAGISAVDCTGWIGNMQKNMTLGVLSHADGHAWVMAWLGNDWYLFDPLFDRYQCKDKTFISKWYFFDLIDGVCPYYDEFLSSTSITKRDFFTKTAVSVP